MTGLVAPALPSKIISYLQDSTTRLDPDVVERLAAIRALGLMQIKAAAAGTHHNPAMTATHEQHVAPDVMLAAGPLFTGLAPKTLARIARSSMLLDVDAGTVLFKRGELCNGLYGLLSGRVKLSLPSDGSDEKVVTLLGPGQTFAEAVVFLDEPHLLTAQTLTASKLLRVEKDALPGCMKADPQFASRVVQTLSRRVRELIVQVETAAMLSGTQRVVDFLLRELRGGSDSPSTIALPAKKRIIASQLDLTQEHFSRILHELTEASLLVVQGSLLTVPDTGKLRAYRDASRQSRHAQDARRARSRD